MSRPDDAVLLRVLRVFGVGSDALLGSGGEASVYALDHDRVLRVHHRGTSREGVEGRRALLSELGKSAARVPFAVPTVLDTTACEGRFVTIEPRLPGRPLTETLGESSGDDRVSLVRAYLDAAAAIGDLVIRRPWYGELSDAGAIRTETFREYLEKRAARSLSGAGREFGGIDPRELAAALPEPAQAALVHMDAFPGNMLAEHGQVTAVLDFGTVSIVGDRRLDPLTAAAYLAPLITPTATDSDLRVARQWLADRGLDDLYEPALRWIAAFWSVARDDLRLHRWCRSILLD
jgi:hypothetical protein